MPEDNMVWYPLTKWTERVPPGYYYVCRRYDDGMERGLAVVEVFHWISRHIGKEEQIEMHYILGEKHGDLLQDDQYTHISKQLPGPPEGEYVA